MESNKAQQSTIEPQPSGLEKGPIIRFNLEVLSGALRLDGRGAPRQLVVPVGRVIVLSYGYEFADTGGLPEVYLAGEIITRNRLRAGVPCWALELLEFPGKVEIEASQFLPEISQSENDRASLYLSFYIRLYDPILLLRRTAGKWEKEEERLGYNQRTAEDLRVWLASLLEKDLRLWSDDEQDVLRRVFTEVDGYLRRIGLRVDTAEDGSAATAMTFTRRYPRLLHDLAFQFIKAERLIRRLAERDKPSLQGLGLSDRAIRAIRENDEPAGTALFTTLQEAPPDVKRQIADWLSEQGMQKARSFIQDLEKYSEREAKLSEQVLLAAIRNPWLTQGEWLRKVSEPPLSRFQQIERKIETSRWGS